MKKRIIFLFVAIVGMTLQSVAQSALDTADRNGLVGFWKLMEMNGRANGEIFSKKLDGSSFYIFKNNGICQYSTNNKKTANAKWTLNGKTLHVWGKDKVNDPNGIDYKFTLVMVSPDKLVIKRGNDNEYVYSIFRKSNTTLKPIGGSTRTELKIETDDTRE